MSLPAFFFFSSRGRHVMYVGAIACCGATLEGGGFKSCSTRRRPALCRIMTTTGLGWDLSLGWDKSTSGRGKVLRRALPRRLLVAAAALSSASALSSQLSSAPTSSQLSSQLLRRVRRNDVAGSAAADTARPFLVGGEEYGRVLPQAAAVLAEHGGPYLHVTEDSVFLDDAACAAAEGATVEEQRTSALAELFSKLREADAIPMLSGWRDEPFAVRCSFHAPQACVVERAAAPLLGLPAYGVFTTGYVCDEGTRRPSAVWIGRRAANKPTWPGLLDSIAAGGLKAGQLPFG